MWHKPCRTFHPWCLCIKTRCLLDICYVSEGNWPFVWDRAAGDLRCHRAHYDVIVMLIYRRLLRFSHTTNLMMIPNSCSSLVITCCFIARPWGPEFWYLFWISIVFWVPLTSVPRRMQFRVIIHCVIAWVFGITTENSARWTAVG